MDQIEYSFEEEHLIDAPMITSIAIKAIRCNRCEKVMFINSGLDYPEELRYLCPNCRNLS